MDDVWFDDSLPQLVGILLEIAGREFVEAGTVLRDATGRLSFFAGCEPKDEKEIEKLQNAVTRKLKDYARPDVPVRFLRDNGAASILESPDRVPIQINDVFCQLLDRRIVGAAWLSAPSAQPTAPPRVVFATLKGGVGRSTALAVAAADLARRSQNVLVIDLDLEAPGLGTMLLGTDEVPAFGAIDYLVENGIGGVRDACLDAFLGSSGLTAPGGGRVDVMPALGRRSLTQPHNILPKLARAMIEDILEDRVVSVTEQISTMILRMTERAPYDVVLIDSRAGLSELAAPAVLGLGATVLLFANAQKQTIDGYRALFAALQLLAQRDILNDREAEWRTMIKPVYAKANLDASASDRFIDDFYELYSNHIYDAEVAYDALTAPLSFSRDDTSAPHWPLVIPFNPAFSDFDPTMAPEQLTEPFYEQTYRPFLSRLDAAMASSETGDAAGGL